MKKYYFELGDFRFMIQMPKDFFIPSNFKLFEQKEGFLSDYNYYIDLADSFPKIDLEPTYANSELSIYKRNDLEIRNLSYAFYEEKSANEAVIYCNSEFSELYKLDTVFTSLFALERRMLQHQGLVLHCSYLTMNNEAILFSGPSGIGKSTQAGLWQRYKEALIHNGDRALLQKNNERWNVNGWPVCGSSDICEAINSPLRAIVMLSQSETNQVKKLSPMEAFSNLYGQITVNRWDSQAVLQSTDLISELVAHIPVYHFSCNISEEAVHTLYQELFI